jgi:hypothetical protein
MACEGGHKTTKAGLELCSHRKSKNKNCWLLPKLGRDKEGFSTGFRGSMALLTPRGGVSSLQK